MALKIKGGVVKTSAALKASLKKGGGSGYMTRVPADGAITVRFLTEPEGNWVEYLEHYDAVRKFYPCVEGDCPGCEMGDSPSRRYLANVLHVEEGRVVPLAMPKSLAASVEKKYTKYGTLLDRDYELTRDGTGFDTTYDCTPEAPTKINIGRYDLLDLKEILVNQLEMADNAESKDEDEDENEPVARKRAAKKTTAKRKPEPVDDDEDEDEDEDDEEEEAPAPKRKPAAKKTAPAKRTPKAAVVEEDDEDEDEDEAEEPSLKPRAAYSKMTLVNLKKAAVADAGLALADLKGLDKDAIIDLMFGEVEEADEEEDEEVDEEDLRAMSLAEVKAVAREQGIKIKAGTPKDEIIELILDAAADAEEDEDEIPF